MSGIILMVTRGRPHNLQRLIEYSKPQLPAAVALDEDDAPSYRDVKLPDNWEYVIYPKARVATQLNRLFADYPDKDYYAVIADDVMPEPGWDVEMDRLAAPDKIVWPHDDMKGQCTHPWLGGDIMRAVGWLAAPGIKHFYLDNVWGNIAAALWQKGLVHHVHINHLHFTKGAPYDATYRNRPSVQDDRDAYLAFMQEGWPDTMERIRCFM